jgi:hypothetical protein
MDGKVPVITATVSFGMGVDKASVRYRHLLGFNRSGSVNLFFSVGDPDPYVLAQTNTGHKHSYAGQVCPGLYTFFHLFLLNVFCVGHPDEDALYHLYAG